MKIAVCVKQVPDATVHKRLDPSTYRLDRSGEGTLGAVINDPTVYEDLKEVLGNVKRNRVLRELVRYSISNNENLDAVGKPQDGNRYRLFVRATGFGIDVRLEGKVTPDPATGQLTTTFADGPQLPFTDFKLEFDDGPHSVVATPLKCGEAKSTSSLVPWSGNASVGGDSTFTVDGPAKELVIGIGLNRNNADKGQDPKVTFTPDEANGALVQWTEQKTNGALGTAIIVPSESFAGYAEGDYLFFDWLNFKITFDYSDNDSTRSTLTDDSKNRVKFGLEPFLNRFLQLRLFYSIANGVESIPARNQNQLYAEVHLFF